ncbi:MAG: hypothetical protein KAW89_08040 [Armatimonadetes bacterium]|nr:hypothetical protein [Armatimonadota bacterium]
MYHKIGIATLIVIAMLAAGCGGGGGGGNGGPDVYTVYGENAEVGQGGTTAVSIYLAKPPATPAGYQMTINYDDSKLQLVGGMGAVQVGAAVPASPNHIIAKNVSTAGVVQVTVVGWNGSEIVNLSTTNNEILSIQFQAIGPPGVVAIDIDTTAGAPTQLQFWTSGASQIAPPTAVIDGTVTINP